MNNGSGQAGFGLVKPKPDPQGGGLLKKQALSYLQALGQIKRFGKPGWAGGPRQGAKLTAPPKGLCKRKSIGLCHSRLI